jgi:protein gp37
MAKGSKIEWTGSTWNPVTGCTKISPGCKHCYAERLAKRLHAMGQPNYRNGFQLALHERSLQLPLTWKRPQMVFVNSMGDLFHDDVPQDFIRRVFAVMQKAEIHTFQVLTKRSERLAELAGTLPWPTNVWVGVSVETNQYLYRIDHLRNVPAQTRFVSFEPLLSGMGHMNLEGINWAIVGGESGPMARPVSKEWVLEIQKQCVSERTAFFFKQWGGTNKKKAGRLLNGRSYSELPAQAPLG